MRPDALETFEPPLYLEPDPAARPRRWKPVLLIVLLGVVTSVVLLVVLPAVANAISSSGSCGGG